MTIDELKLTKAGRALPAALLEVAKPRVRAIVHWREVDEEASAKCLCCYQWVWVHRVAVVTPEGGIVLGGARCSPRDQYVKATGFRPAAERALRETVRGGARAAPGFVDATLTGAKLRRTVKELVMQLDEAALERAEEGRKHV